MLKKLIGIIDSFCKRELGTNFKREILENFANYLLENDLGFLPDGEMYIASERRQFGDQLDFIPSFVFYDESEAMKYKENTCKAITIETCSVATKPVKPLYFLYIEVNTNNGEPIKSEINKTNNYDVASGENINDIYVIGNKMIIKKSCPKDFILNDKTLITQIAKNIIDDIAMRIDKDYEMTCFKPNKEITFELLKEFEQLF